MPRPLSLAVTLLITASLHAQATLPDGHLDPTRNLPVAPNTHVPLPEHYLWTAGDVTAQRPDDNKYPWNRPELRTGPHFFRVAFPVAARPQAARKTSTIRSPTRLVRVLRPLLNRIWETGAYTDAACHEKVRDLVAGFAATLGPENQSILRPATNLWTCYTLDRHFAGLIDAATLTNMPEARDLLSRVLAGSQSLLPAQGRDRIALNPSGDKPDSLNQPRPGWRAISNPQPRRPTPRRIASSSRSTRWNQRPTTPTSTCESSGNKESRAGKTSTHS
jgi:hypothetical protein